MLTLNNLAESLKNVSSESILLSAVPKPDVDLVTDLVKQQTDEFPENLCSVYKWIHKSVNIENYLANLFVDMSTETISEIELLARGKNNNKLWCNYRRGVITVFKAHFILTKINKILKPTGGCVYVWSLCQNISGLSFTNPDLPALKYGQTMEMEAENEFFELMKKKH